MFFLCVLCSIVVQILGVLKDYNYFKNTLGQYCKVITS